MKEIWRDILGYKEKYKVSNFGQVKSLPRTITEKNTDNTYKLPGRILKQQLNKHNGYFGVMLSNQTTQKRHYVHRLVASAFLIKTKDDLVVNHIDGNKRNNHISNLEWVSSKQNSEHASKTFLMNFGDFHQNRKYKAELVLKIRELNKKGWTNREISDKFSVPIKFVWAIVKYKTWGWLKTEKDFINLKKTKEIQRERKNTNF